MLIKCAECSREISDQAPTCPGCGAPTKGTTEAWAVQTIEQTGKKWKSLQSMGVLALIFGVVMLFNGESGGIITWLGGLLFFLGILFTVFGRIGAWWHHG